jgi:hypothetical protein
MKVGTHGDEELSAIVERKRREELRGGLCFWGYGGVSCHPLNQVQIHARQADGKVTCLFIRTMSNPRLSITRSAEYSIDGNIWEPLPTGHVVTSSKWAITLSNLRFASHQIDLMSYVISVGPSAGKSLGEYLRGRSDKACAELVSQSRDKNNQQRLVSVALVADLVAPYAVFLR